VYTGCELVVVVLDVTILELVRIVVKVEIPTEVLRVGNEIVVDDISKLVVDTTSLEDGLADVVVVWLVTEVEVTPTVLEDAGALGFR